MSITATFQTGGIIMSVLSPEESDVAVIQTLHGDSHRLVAPVQKGVSKGHSAQVMGILTQALALGSVGKNVSQAVHRLITNSGHT